MWVGDTCLSESNNTQRYAMKIRRPGYVEIYQKVMIPAIQTETDTLQEEIHTLPCQILIPRNSQWGDTLLCMEILEVRKSLILTNRLLTLTPPWDRLEVYLPRMVIPGTRRIHIKDIHHQAQGMACHQILMGIQPGLDIQ